MQQHSHDERIRLKAYEIWLQEGRPEGRDSYHWAMAREAIGHEDAYISTLQPEAATKAEAPVVTSEPPPGSVRKPPAAKQTKAA